MSDINDVTVVGRLVEKPVLKYSKNGTAVSNLRIASNTYMPNAADQKKVNYFTVVVFAKQAENCEKYLDKGRQIIVNGRLDQNSWEDNSGNKRSMVRIIANRVQFIGGPGQKSSSPSYQEQAKPNTVPDTGTDMDFQDEETTTKDLDNSFESPIEDTDDIPF